MKVIPCRLFVNSFLSYSGGRGRVGVFYGYYRGDFVESSTSKVADVCGNAAKFGRAIDADHVAVGRRRCLKKLRTARRENTPEKYLKPPL